MAMVGTTGPSREHLRQASLHIANHSLLRSVVCFSWLPNVQSCRRDDATVNRDEFADMLRESEGQALKGNRKSWYARKRRSIIGQQGSSQ